MNLQNKHLQELKVDKFHHLGFSTETIDVKDVFKDVKFVCLSGSVNRVKTFAKFVNSELKLMKEDELVDLCSTDRYVMYKVGPILIANHGMGVPSACIILNELFKLLHYAGAEDVTFFRLGTCGGLGVPPGSVVVTRKAVDGLLLPRYTQIVLGELKTYNTEFEHTMYDELFQTVHTKETKLDFEITLGDTMCCDDFYEGQGRLDGAFCSFTKEEKKEFLKKAYESGVRNLEMESLVFAGLCNRVGIKSCIVCVALVDRLNDDDQIVITEEQIKEFEQRPCKLVLEYMKRNISTNGAF